MSSISLRDTALHAERGRDYWSRALLAGAFTPLPRWTRKPVAGVGEHEARIPGEIVTAVRRLADELAVSFSSVLLAAHAKVLGALSGERVVSTGYVATRGRPPLPCRITLEPRSWRAMVLESKRTVPSFRIPAPRPFSIVTVVSTTEQLLLTVNTMPCPWPFSTVQCSPPPTRVRSLSIRRFA